MVAAEDLPDLFASVAGGEAVSATQLDGNTWAVAIHGHVRRPLTVLVHVGQSSWWARSFVLRGPDPRRSGDPHALHRLLLRRNAGLRHCRFALDVDDDVVLECRLDRATLSAGLLDTVLAEMHQVIESAFEPLVHLGYPGTFQALPR